MLDLASAQKHLTRVDPTLGSLMRRWGECTLEPDEKQSPYEALFRSVVYQQLNGKAAGTILGRVKALFPRSRIPTPERLLAMDEASLRAAGLSRNKMLALRDLAQKRLDGVVPTHAQALKLTDEELVERLCEVRGIGRWTVEMMLMFKLGRPDVLPATDFGVRQGFALLYRYPEMPPPREILEYGERWRPYRTVAAWYMWRAVDLERGVRAE